MSESNVHLVRNQVHAKTYCVTRLDERIIDGNDVNIAMLHAEKSWSAPSMMLGKRLAQWDTLTRCEIRSCQCGRIR